MQLLGSTPPPGRRVKIVVLTALWRRPNLARLVLRRYRAIQQELAGEIDFDFVAVGSEGKLSREMAVAEGWHYVEARNNPLGGKWNAAMPTVRKLSPDGLVIVGSDDWLSTPAFRFYAKGLRDGVPLMGFKDIYFLYWKTARTLYFGGYQHPTRVGESLGLGRCLPRAALEALSWTPWWQSLNRGLDYSMMKRLRKLHPVIKDGARIVRMADVGACAIDIKTPVGICSVQSYLGSKLPNGKRNVEWVATDKLLMEHFPKVEAQALLGYVGSLRTGGTP